MKSYEEYLKQAVEYHGHLCAGQILGVRMTMLALKHFGIEDPDTYKDLVAFVEADRCVADAVSCIGHCHMGRRRLKWYDYGKSAASFYDMNCKKAIRINTQGNFFPGPDDDINEYFGKISDEELFCIRPVEIDIKPEDLPGKPLGKAVCEVCGETVMDNRHVVKDGKVMCKACAGDSYYRYIGDEK